MKVPRLRPSFSLRDLFKAALIHKPNCEEVFEQSFAEQFGFPYGLFFPYGRSAFAALLGALEWNDAEIVLPAYSCVVMPHAVVLSGNQVRFVDCESRHFNVSAQALAQSLSPSTKMVVPTPLFGYPVDSQGYHEAISRNSPAAFVLYDVAQSYGAVDSDTNQFENADGAIFAFGVGKLLCSLYGGMLLLRDQSLFQLVKKFRNQNFTQPGTAKTLGRFMYGLSVWAAFREPFLNLADFLEKRTSLLYRFTEYYYGKQGPCFPGDYQEKPASLQVNLGMLQLSKYRDIIMRRRDIASYYEKKLVESGIPVFPGNKEGTYSHFPLAVENREQVTHELSKMGIQVGHLVDYACSDLPGYEKFHGSCPNASWFGARMINLPIWDGLTHSQADRIVEALKTLHGRYPNLFPSLLCSSKNRSG